MHNVDPSLLCAVHPKPDAGADPGFSEGGSEHRGGSLKQGSGGRSPPEDRVLHF